MGLFFSAKYFAFESASVPTILVDLLKVKIVGKERRNMCLSC